MIYVCKLPITRSIRTCTQGCVYRSGHIILLGQRVVNAFLKERVWCRDRGRLNVILGSRVTLLSEAKGRSSSSAFGRQWKAIIPFQLAGHITLGYRASTSGI